MGSNAKAMLKILNKALELGHFPKIWKKGQVCWLPKKDKTVRPITLLPALGKVLDRIINKRLQHLLENNNMIDDHQYGYRQGVSAIDALQSLTDKFKANKANGLHQLVASLDLSNAFNAA